MWANSRAILMQYLLLWSQSYEEQHWLEGASRYDLLNIPARFCPATNICTEPTPEHNRPPSTCCGGCSCDKSCGLRGNCCYEHLDQYKFLERGFLMCLSQVRGNGTDISLEQHMFYFGSPNSSCAAVCYNDNPVPFETFYPAYSGANRMNYVNEDCARCHGVTDLTMWKSVLVHTRPLSDQIVTMFDFFQTKSIDSGFMLFMHPGNITQKLGTRCSVDLVSNCTSTYSVLLRANITDDHREACYSGPRAPSFYHSLVFRNIFCAACNDKLADRCRVDLKDYHDEETPFISLLDDKVVNLLTKDTQKTANRLTPKPVIACPRKRNDTRKCRKLFCPMMQVMGPDGVCYYPSKTWVFQRYSITIKLTATSQEPFRDIDFDLKHKEFDIYWAIKRYSPWSKAWSPDLVAKRTFEHAKWFYFELVVNLNKHPKEEVVTSLFMKRITDALSSAWIIQLNADTFLTMRQELLRHAPLTLVHDGNTEIVVPLWSVGYHGNEINIPTWEKRYIMLPFTENGTFHITKLLFSKQVELAPDELTFHGNNNLITKLTWSSQFLYNAEFVISSYVNGEKKQGVASVRICLDDADMADMADEGSGHGISRASMNTNCMATCLSFALCISLQLRTS